MDLLGAQGTGFPAPVSMSFLDATPTGEVQVRVRKENTRTDENHARDFIPQMTDSIRRRWDSLYQSERPDVAARSFGNRNESAYVESAKVDRQRLSHGRGDTALYTRPNFTSGQDPKDTREVDQLQQGISHGSFSFPTSVGARLGEQPVTMPSGGMRVTPWKVRTGTETSTMCNGRERESSRQVSGSEDNFEHCDDQRLRRSSQLSENYSQTQNERQTHGISKQKKSANYDGTSSWQDYLVHFEMVSEINGWDDNTKALELATSLRGSAQAILSDLRPDLRRSYTHLVAALTSRFQPSNQAELYRAQMKNKTRTKGQSLPELAEDIKRLTRLAYPTAPIEVREQLSRDCFMDSLSDPDLEWAIFQGKPLTIDDSVRIGLEYEAFTTGHRRKFPNRVALRRQTEIFEESDEDDTMSNIFDRLARIEKHARKPKPSVTCFFCGIKGHMKKDCRKYQAL